MPNKVKHLRGTAAEWTEHDPVIDDGELALLITDTGRYRMKIGNGEDKFSDLEMFGGEVYNLSETEVTMKHCADIRLGTCDTLTVNFPNKMDDDYYSVLTFTSPLYDMTFSHTASAIWFSGSDCYERVFAPAINMHYTLFFWYDGKIQCHVRGIDNA